VSTPAEVAALLAHAERVVVVPGYGLALAQAQHTLRALADALAARGTRVGYAVHPVAGRLPGHLNLLLDQAGVPREQQLGLDEADLAGADVALVVGAHDVVDPAAGIPVLDVRAAGHVVVLKRTTGPGFAGTASPLLHDPATVLLLGDAGRTLRELVAAVVALGD
jgi:H+-translocating NAD(P) transhydrogenase subunit beta